MSLLAESLVEEWLNRNSFFTIRGIKHGIGELDLLGIRWEVNGSITGWHVEVQVSFRPIGYITRTTREMARASGRARGTAKRRTADELEACVREWVQDKFTSRAKQQVRKSLWSDMNWSFHLVHGIAREPKELGVLEKEGVICHPFSKLLDALSKRSDHGYSGSAGGDLAEIVAYYKLEKQNTTEEI